MQTREVLVTVPHRPAVEQSDPRREAEIALSDPLKAETRKARLYLLGLSMVSITMVYTGLVPQEISTLGITFGKGDRHSLFVILTLVILYFLMTFTIYGISDFLSWRYAYSMAQWIQIGPGLFDPSLPEVGKTATGATEDATGEEATPTPDERTSVSTPRPRIHLVDPPPALAKPVSWVRALLEFLLPLLVALFAIYALLSA